MTQKLLVLNRLKRGPLTQLQALRELGVMRLASRIDELRQSGNRIDTEMIEVEKADRTKSKVARYRLIEPAIN